MCTQSSEIVGLLLGGVVFLARNRTQLLGIMKYYISYILMCKREVLWMSRP